ncbi:MAG TPA: restriction endonuclease, partial [Marinilabiliaceae bacterium]|nr:restriction endonuclease [Marinilabiliaceae bacterium]
MPSIEFDDLYQADLIVDALYKGGSASNLSSEPISKLLPCGNQGGVRYSGSIDPFELVFVVLYSSLADPDWPDRIDFEAGQLTYFGDNKTPG